MLRWLSRSLRPMAICAAALAGLTMAAATAGAAEAPRDGVLDLRGWDVAGEPLRRLQGWTLHWGELIAPEAFAGPAMISGGRPARIPEAWDMRALDGSARAGEGVATYRLRVLLPERAPPLAIRLPVTYSASVLWAGGVALIVNGAPGRDAGSERRYVQDRVAPLPAAATTEDGRVLELVLQVSNHIMLGAGPTRPVSIGTADALYQERGRQLALDLFVTGACAIAGAVFLALFATRPREHGFAWFGGLCISVALTYAHLSDVLVMLDPELIAHRPNPYLIFLLFASMAGAGLFLLVIASLYPRELPVRRAAVAGAVLMLYPATVVAGRHFGIEVVLRNLEVVRTTAQALVLAGFAYAVLGLALAALRRRPGAAVALAATLVFAAAVLHDLSLVRAGTPADATLGLALLVLVLAYATILGGRLNAAFAAAETSSRELLQLTRTLEHKVAERTVDLERAARRAEAADRAKSQFLAAANHDLRQPLHAMALIVGVLDNRLSGSALREQVDALKACLAGTERLLGGVLDIAKLDAGAVRPELAACDLDAVLRQAALELAPAAVEGGVRLRLANTRHHALADAAMLARIVGNLVGNAVKYAPGGRVLIGCRRRGDRVRIEVWDDGVGIPEAEHERIFAEFHQAAPVPGREQEGLGLGLAITRRFARLMGGDIAVRSAPGRGSCFALELPRVAAPEAPAAVPVPALRGGSGIEGVRVMVIDDDAMVLRAVAPLLADWGCRAMTALDPGAAIAMLRDGAPPPDVLIVDSHLGPDDRGHLAIGELRRVVGHDLPAAIVTGDTTPERLRALAGLGFPVLHKPIQPGNLASLIRHLARARRLGAAGGPA